VSTAGPLLARLADGLFQQAFVVADLDAACAAFENRIGCSAFATMPAADLQYDLRGERVTCALTIGFARSGSMQLELIQPVRGQGLHVEFLASNGPGAHHLGFIVDDLDAEIEHAASLGFANVMGSQFGSLKFCYLDTWDALGLFVELVEDPDEMMMALMPWR
jgi:hypothetical protein